MANSSERRRRAGQRQAVVDGVAAYLADQDADVYNIMEAAVRDDGVAAVLHLTALAAAAIQTLAEETGRTPDDVLRSLSRA